MNLPDYNFLSAPLWLVSVLHVLTLALHFVAMNILAGGIIVVLLGKFNDKWNHPVVTWFIKLFPYAMAATVTLGVAPLLFVQLVYSKQIYAASITSAWFWLMIVAVAITSYYLLYSASFAANKKPVAIYLSLALIGFLYISFVYSSVFSMAECPDVYQTLYAGNQSGIVINPDIGSYLLRWLHMLLGATTVGGFLVGMFGKDDQQAFATGKRFFLWGMIAAMVLGLIYMLTLGETLGPFMRSAGIWMIVISLVLSLASLHFFFKKNFVISGVMTFLSLLGMVVARHTLRLLRLDGTFDPCEIPVRIQWSPLILFLICFVIAVGVVWYMIALAFTRGSDSSTQG